MNERNAERPSPEENLLDVSDVPIGTETASDRSLAEAVNIGVEEFETHCCDEMDPTPIWEQKAWAAAEAAVKADRERFKKTIEKLRKSGVGPDSLKSDQAYNAAIDECLALFSNDGVDGKPG